MSDKKKYKDTLNPRDTDFDMRAGLVAKEPAIQARWTEMDLPAAIREARIEGERFILHDGPPYANGAPHMGHVLNKTLKDVVVRLKTMTGMNTGPYVHGWDCHGQPIEQEIVKKLGEKMAKLTREKIRELCGKHAETFIAVQAEQFKRLGSVGDFNAPYITMDPAYESAVLEVFAGLVDQGLVYRQLKPVHWSIENRTALAEAELEYQDRDDQSVYVAFEVTENAAAVPRRDGDTVCLAIWTTTPWTLPANLAVAVGENLEYTCLHVDTADGPLTLVAATSRVDALLAAMSVGRDDYVSAHETLGTVTGSELLAMSLKYAHPLLAGKTCPVVAADYVTIEDGTGLVHTAPGHGVEDYMTGLREGLDIYCPVQGDGTFDETAPEFLRGQSVWDANGLVIDRLTQNARLLAAQTITHSYPHDWRSKTPTIFRATDQWFIAVDEPTTSGGQSLRKMAMAACNRPADEDGIDFIPDWGRNRMLGMLESRPDWCISRQRTWGLPIPAFMTPDGQTLLTADSVRAIARVVAEKGSDAWFAMTPAELLADYDLAGDDAVENEAFNISELEKGTDIFDVWFESGSSWFAVAMQRGLVENVPVEMYLEGSDQHRGWFQLSLLPSLGAAGVPPFKTLLTHGFVVDKDGRKMSKSEGNVVDAVEQLSKRGADVLRLWVASQDYQNDVRCSDELIAQSEDAYRKIRNTLRFCMMNCCDFDPASDAAEPANHSVDRWMRLELHQLIRDVREAYDRYEFHRAMRMVYEFCTLQASSVYLAAVKDRLYCESPDALRRRASQTVIYEMLTALVKLLAPVLPHTCEEAWAAIPNRPADEPESVHLCLLPDYDEGMLQMAEDLRDVNVDLATATPDQLEAGPDWIWTQLMLLRDQGLLKLEALRNAGVKNPLDTEAVFIVAADREPLADVLEYYIRELEDLLGVGYAYIDRSGDPADGVINVEVRDTREKYPRCARSWKRRPDVGSNSDYPDLSARDAAVMKERRD